MKLAVLKEKQSTESRVSVTPDLVKDYDALGIQVAVQSGCGVLSGFCDDDYKSAGASIAPDSTSLLEAADIITCVAPPSSSDINHMQQGAMLIGLLAANQDDTIVKKCANQNVSAFSMELVPRITRAQSMDVLSSQSNLAGYKAVIDAVAEFERVVPMMMTAAGTIRPANVLILGAGVAGLQAIATAKRLGAVVSAFDVRPNVKEQVESLGGTFIEVENNDKEDAETKGGYAKEMSDDYKKKQSALIAETLKSQDIVICTALIPGKPAPELISQAMLKDMKPGSVIVDLAAIAGGNCAGSVADNITIKNDIKIIGYTNMPGRLPNTASQLYAKNVFNFVKPIIDTKAKRIKIDFEDDIIQGTLVTHGGKIIHPSLSK